MDTMKNLGVMRLAVMGSVLAALLGFFFMITDRITEPDMALLYADLDMGDGAQIVSRLEGLGVEVELKGGGTQIYVPSNQVARLRMSMAEAGLPSGGSMGYEIFDRSDVLGSTSFVQDINRLRALEGELSRSIRSINNVASVRVHLVLPKRELFSKQPLQPSASIILKMRGKRLNAAQVEGIQHLAAAAVAGLAPANISIIDERGTLLARGDDGDQSMAFGLEEKKLNVQSRMARTIETLLERSVGPGKVRAEVSVDIERDRVTENSELYDPEGQVMRSSQTSEEGVNSSESKASGATSVKSNIPNADQGGEGNKSTNKSNRTDETVNYEISRTLKTKIHEAGGIKRISAAVLVDGVYKAVEGGEATYAPRPKEELDQMLTLIKTAIGFDEKRGDKVEIINMRFAPETVIEGEVGDDLFMGFARHEVIRMAETLVLALVSLLALLFVVKPLVGRLLSGAGQAQPRVQSGVQGRDETVPSAVGVGGEALPPGAQPVGAIGAPAAKIEAPQASEEMVAIDNIVGHVKMSSLQKIEDIVDDKPAEAVAQIRAWMQEGNAA